MNREGVFSQRIYPVLFMSVLTIVFIAVVSGIYLFTEERVKLNETIVEKKAVLYAAGIEYPDNDPVRVNEIYEKHVQESEGRHDYFEVKLPSGDTVYAVYVEGPGLWGQIVTIFGFRENLETLTGIEVVKQSETPGLGARITESWFREQFRGKEPPFVTVPEGTADEADEIDAITGATKTSEAFKAIANKAESVVKKKVEEEG